jgi:nicotinamide-nucleotide amidase
MNATIITIGDELLIGQVIDTNSAWMSDKLNEIGVDIQEKVSISDSFEAIHSTLDRVLEKSDLILITGGLGPTKDDITKKALADYFMTDLVFHQPTWDRIQRLFSKWGRSTTKAHKQQCFMPRDAELLRNKMGTAPGMLFYRGHKMIVSMPGVPYEMKFIMSDSLLPLLMEKTKESAIVHYTIRTVGEGESRLSAQIEDIEEQLPAHIKLAFLPSLGQVRIRLTGRGKIKEKIKQEVLQYGSIIDERLSQFVFGHHHETLEEVLGTLCRNQKVTIGTAESCTGGAIAQKITSIPGSSDYFHGSVVAYSNQVKEQVLQVSEKTLLQYGAVSEETVIEMLSGLFKILPIDVGIAVSGIAGPGGGTKDKPVGTIWIAYGSKNNIRTYLLQATKDRAKNIQYTTVYALNLIRKFLIGLE